MLSDPNKCLVFAAGRLADFLTPDHLFICLLAGSACGRGPMVTFSRPSWASYKLSHPAGPCLVALVDTTLLLPGRLQPQALS